MVPADEVVQNLLGEKEIPILCERDAENPLRLVTVEENTVRIHFDLLGGAFYILTRMEEYLSPVRDEYDRFPAYASHALIHGYLHRPVVDEYVEILWHCIKRLWPGAKRRNESFRMMVTHDVDEPFRYAFRPARKALRTFGGDLLRRHDVKSAFVNLTRWIDVKHLGNWQRDPSYTFELIMNISESYNLQSTFYFLSGGGHAFDGNYFITHPLIKQLITKINARGHEIGYHGSFETYRDHKKTKKEVDYLKKTIAMCGIDQAISKGRQHYLRWVTPITWANYEKSYLKFDSTLSYADAAGFRCGSCHDFMTYDIINDNELTLIEQPLITMEGSLFGGMSKRHVGLSDEDAVDLAILLKNQCKKYRGNFVLLWHNSSLITEKMIRMYEDILRG